MVFMKPGFGDGTLIVVVGPFPPPVHGAAAMTLQASCLLEKSGHKTIRCNVGAAPQKNILRYHLRRIGLYILACWTCLWAGKGYVLYHSLSGGLGLFYDLMVIAAARIGGAAHIVLHHHSFAYLDKPQKRFRLVLWCAGRKQVHIALCYTMAARLRQHYGNSLDCRIVSNMAFLDNPLYQPAHAGQSGHLTIGYLSNITLEKGIDRYLDLLEILRGLGSKATGLIAGPFENVGIGEYVTSRIASIGNINYLGPLYGKAKENFFSSLDFFVFPSRYFNEAQPLVIFEAQMAGVPVIATGNGCMGEMLKSEAGIVLANTDRESIVLLAKKILECETSIESMESLKVQAQSFRHDLMDISIKDRDSFIAYFAEIDALT